MKYAQFVEEKLSFQGNESFNALRTNIEYSGNNIKAIAITSATPNNGKSVIALELSKSFAKSGKRTLLLDADLRKSVLKEKNTESGNSEYGLTDLLVDKIEVQNAVCKTNIKNFYCVFAGHVPPNPSELLGSEAFYELMDYLKSYFDIIIVDTPPVGSVIDAVLVAKACDGAVIVVNPGRTRMSYLKDINNQMSMTGVKVLGTIIHQNEKELKGYGYGYSYGYGYGYGYGRRRRKKYAKYGYGNYGYYGYYGSYGYYGYGNKPQENADDNPDNNDETNPQQG